jgi:hypothetical protein
MGYWLWVIERLMVMGYGLIKGYRLLVMGYGRVMGYRLWVMDACAGFNGYGLGVIGY